KNFPYFVGVVYFYIKHPVARGWLLVGFWMLGVFLGLWVRLYVGRRPGEGGTTEGSVFFTNR
ncbi:hypothetical protein ACVGWQ_24560, partial [Enterobacter hormaechei]